MTSQSLTDSVAQQRLDWSLTRVPVTVVDLSGSDSSSTPNAKRARVSSDFGVTSPPPPAPETPEPISVVPSPAGGWKQFWNAGDYEGVPGGRSELTSGGMDHVRVHPKFLHSNATSHKWALGAFAELVDNSLDEVCNGATFVNMDVLESKKDGSRMLMIEDNGGGMDPDRMRQCMSLGYSAKTKMANTIGQYGNGFKTSTMRLGPDVIVFSRCLAKDGKPLCQSIGLLSYTFLRSTCKEDIVVPILDYQRRGREWTRLVRSSADWKTNVDTIVQWSPFSSEQDLFLQFNLMRDHGTRIIIYNLWEDDQGLLELDFDSDSHDIQLRGVNRDEKSIQMASQYPNSRHFLTYRHSLRSYASILYLRLPPGFRIILRGKDVEHHNLVNDMMMAEEKTYKPKAVGKDCAMVTVGFVKDAKHHIDVQGFNVYHKNRLIKPFWRLWNAAGSDGRGVIGVLEANFVEPAHNKQGFERTTVLARLEAKLIQMQKTYWSSLCHKIGYAPRRNKKLSTPPESCQLKKNLRDQQVSPPQESGHLKRKLVDEQVSPLPESGHLKRRLVDEQVSPPQESCHLKRKFTTNQEAHKESEVQNGPRTPSNSAVTSDKQLSPPHLKDKQDCEVKRERNILQKEGLVDKECHVRDAEAPSVEQLKEENRELRERLEKRGETVTQLLQDLQYEKDGCRLLEMQIQEAQRKIEELNKEQESLIEIFSEERERREMEEENLRNKLKVASNTIQELLNKVDTK